MRTIKPITDSDTCTRECYMEPLCSSINYCVKPGEESWCELVNTDQTRNAADMKDTVECTHYSASVS